MSRAVTRNSSFRSSQRSHGSSSTSENDPREKIKDCFRKFIAFMCTQVGVGGLVVCYAILGAFTFMNIEQNGGDVQLLRVKSLHDNCTRALWQVTMQYNVFNEEIWSKHADPVLKKFQSELADAVRRGYDGRSALEMWSLPAALMYCLSVFSMIGYGNMVPRTSWGKGVTVLYAGLGIPIYILYFMNMGNVLAKSFKWLYASLRDCGRRGDATPNSRGARLTVPSTACLWVLSFYVLSGTIMFAMWENWNYLDSTYFCVTSLTKIGFGDYVPGANILDSRSGSQTKLVINFVYMLLGMGLIAMCYNLMREDVRVKVTELKGDMKQCLEDFHLKISRCMRKPQRR